MGHVLAEGRVIGVLSVFLAILESEADKEADGNPADQAPRAAKEREQESERYEDGSVQKDLLPGNAEIWGLLDRAERYPVDAAPADKPAQLLRRDGELQQHDPDEDQAIENEHGHGKDGIFRFFRPWRLLSVSFGHKST